MQNPPLVARPAEGFGLIVAGKLMRKFLPFMVNAFAVAIQIKREARRIRDRISNLFQTPLHCLCQRISTGSVALVAVADDESTIVGLKPSLAAAIRIFLR